MKVLLYMAITANGQIATLDGKTPWSSEEFAAYEEMLKQTRCEIIGRITYEDFSSGNSSPKNHLVVVLSSKVPKEKPDNVIFCNSIEKAIKILEAKRFSQCLVAGGSKTNKSALEKGIIDEIYLDVEPFIFGQGLPLFAPIEKELKLKLLGIKNLSSQTIQLHYKVIK